MEVSRELKQLDTREMAPLCAFFRETADGIVHSRALGWQTHHLAYGFRLIDRQQKSFFYTQYVYECLGTRTSIIATVAVIFVGISALFGSSGISTTLSSLALHQASFLGDAIYKMAQAAVMFDDTWTTMSDLLLCIESMPQEPQPADLDLPEDWPANGKVELKEVTARYGYVACFPLIKILSTYTLIRQTRRSRSSEKYFA